MNAIEFFNTAYKAYPRYWHHANRDSIDPHDFQEPWRTLLQQIENRQRGSALDLGAGEGADAIRLARLGYEVDAVEGSEIGADKIERFAREAGTRVNVIHADAASFTTSRQYDVIVCSGLLHYIDPARQNHVLATLKNAVVDGGLTLVTMFTDHTALPECHRLIDVFPDRNGALLTTAYRGSTLITIIDRDKLDQSHFDFPPHHHSFVKILAQR